MSVSIQLDNTEGWGMIPVAGEHHFYDVWVPLARKHGLNFITDIADNAWYQFDYEGFIKLLEDFREFRNLLEAKTITTGNEVEDAWLIERAAGIISSLEQERHNSNISGSIG